MPVLTEAGIGRAGRRVLIGVVVLGLLVIAAGAVAFVRRDEIRTWADAPAVLDAHRTMQTLDLPAGFTDDTTLTACTAADPVRCAWTDQTAPDALEALVGALRDAGLEPGPVVCDSAALPEALSSGEPTCGAPLELSGATAWAVAVDRTLVGGVPLGRTAVWVMWDEASMSSALLDRLVPELDLPVLELEQPAPDLPLSPAEVAALMPARYRFADAAEWVRTGETSDGGEPEPFEVRMLVGDVDVSDLGADPVPALVAELTDAGLYVLAGNADPRASVSVSALRFFRDDEGRRHGLHLIVRWADGELSAEVWPW